MKTCSICGLLLSLDAYPRNRSGPCKACHNAAARLAYRQRKAARAADAILAAEEAVMQLWEVACLLCGWDKQIRRRATARPFVLVANAYACERCGAGCMAALVSGPATLGAAIPEIERVTRVLR